jgi:hypothetical protein
MRIRYSESPPTDAAVAVQYRDTWFYIQDSDLNSASTFSLVGQVFALQAGNTQPLVPMLTLPVGGG